MMIDDLDVISYVMTIFALCTAGALVPAIIYLGVTRDE